jgi:hypothetical protein
MAGNEQVKFSPDGSRVAGISADGRLTVWNTEGTYATYTSTSVSADPDPVINFHANPDPGPNKYRSLRIRFLIQALPSHYDGSGSSNYLLCGSGSRVLGQTNSDPFLIQADPISDPGLAITLIVEFCLLSISINYSFYILK